MKNSIKKLIDSQSANQPLNPAGFFSVKGGSFSLLLISNNPSKCSNTGTSCSGTNSGGCVNSSATDCSKTTNTPATSCTTS